MAYSTDNPPACISSTIGGTASRIWSYSSTDAVTVVRVDGYITDGDALGMKVGDVVLVLDTDASPVTGAWCWVSAVTAGGGADLSDGVTITGTNSD